MKLVKKYILNSFIQPFTGALAAFLFIMIIAHFFDFLHVFLKFKPPMGLLAKYFILRLPEWFTTIVPVATLIGTLLSLGKLQKNNEITAIKSSGIKLSTVLVPLFILSIFISLTTGLINETVVPQSKPLADKLFLEIKEKKPRVKEDFRRNIIYMGEQSKLYFITYFKDEIIEGIKIIEHYPGSSIEKKLIVAEKAVYAGHNIWNFKNGTLREFSNEGEETKYIEFKRRKFNLSEVPSDFQEPAKEPHKMGISELKKYISKLERSGMSTRREEVLFHYKIAFPFASTIILLLGIPIALFKGIHSKALSFFFALLISFIYWGGLSVGRSMGINGILPPYLAAWSANIVFFIIGTAMLIKAKIILK